MATPPPEAPTRGHKKKARTRRLLLDTALVVLAEQGEGFSVADITGRAGVSHGTFYNYFPDREHLLAALVADVVDAFATEAAVALDEADPARRFARISADALGRAEAFPEPTRVLLRLDGAQDALLAAQPFAHLRQDLVDGHAAGRFTTPVDDATLDVVVGALLQAARRLAAGTTSADYRARVVARLLQTLGVAPDEAAALAAEAVAGG